MMEPIEENPWPRPDSGGRSNNAGTTSAQEQDSTNTVPNTTIEKHVQKRIFKIIVIGDSNVGKTCLTFRFCGGSFPEKTEATIGVDFREKTLEVEGEIIKLQLWDTAGQERFRKSMVQHYYRNVHAVVFVYDVTKVSSFENLPIWIEECDRHNLGRNIPRILVGNKCDIHDKVAVNTNMAQKFADNHNMPVFETSAKDDAEMDHVEAIFLTLAHKLKTAKPLMPPPSFGGMSYNADSSKILSIDKEKASHSSKADKDSCSC